MEPCKLEGPVAGLQADINNLKRWQKTQNGALLRIDAKADKIIWWLIGQLAGLVVLALSIYLSGR